MRRWIALVAGLLAIGSYGRFLQASEPGTVGGHAFSLRANATAFGFSWQGGTLQTGYVLARWSPAAGFVSLPTLSPGATMYDDTPLPPEDVACYVLFPLSVTGSLGLSDLLCGFPRSRTGTNPPGSFAIQLDQSTTATLMWVGPGNQTSYTLQIVPLDGTTQPGRTLDGETTSTTETMGSAGACYILTALAGTTVLGASDIICGVPGVANLPPRPTPTASPSRTPTFALLSPTIGAGTATSTPTSPALGTPTRTPTPATAQTVTPGLPPDPRQVAPPIDRSVATDFAEAIRFLYAGPSPIQVGVAAGTIDDRRVAVLRGQVTDRAGQPIAGVRVTVLQHPEYGSTQTRDDGSFDLAVNGGGWVTVSLQKSGYLPVQRQVLTSWRDFVIVPTSVLTTLDPAVTTIQLGGISAQGQGQCQVAQGSLVDDGAGPRRAIAIFPPGVTANMRLPNGTVQGLSSVRVRLTEFSVGGSGPNAMPGTLPPTMPYAYAAELTVDEAIEAGAAGVTFSQPIAQYVDNLLNLAVGTVIPLQTYDRASGRWVPFGDARVIRILSTAGGFATLDVEGSGQAASAFMLSQMGVSACERQQLATLRPAGATLIRYPEREAGDSKKPTETAEPKDTATRTPSRTATASATATPTPSSTPTGTPTASSTASLTPSRTATPSSTLTPTPTDEMPSAPVAVNPPMLFGGVTYYAFAGPKQEDKKKQDHQDDPCAEFRSIVECENQVLGEELGLVGTPFSLAYRSNRVLGRVEARQVRLFLLPADFAPASIKGVEVEVHVAGQVLRQSLAPAADLQTTITWDGKDVYGRPLQGGQPALLRVGYVYEASYVGAPAGSRTRENPIGWHEERHVFDAWDALPQGLGGWSLSAHHVYDPVARVLRYGDGRVRTGESLDAVVTTLAGTGTRGSAGDGGPAILAQLNQPWDLEYGPDGSLYIADIAACRVRRIDPEGVITTVAGSGQCPGGFGPIPDGPALEMPLFPYSLAVGLRGELYVGESANCTVRRLDPDGQLRRVAGNGQCAGVGSSGDGGLATAAQLFPRGLAVGRDGALYIVDEREDLTHDHRLRRVDLDGRIHTIAGGPTPGFSGDDGPAALARLNGPRDVAVAADGSILVADTGNNRVRRIGPDGRIETIAGNGNALVGTDGAQARATGVGVLARIAAGRDGGFASPDGLIQMRPYYRGGVINRLTAGGAGNRDEGLPARLAGASAQVVAFAPDGSVVFDDRPFVNGAFEARLRRIAAPLPGFTGRPIQIPSEDGGLVYEFDPFGRHLRTRHALTGATLLTFSYDSAGRLGSVTDADGNTTTIERASQAASVGMTVAPTGVVGPYGQRTILEVDANGYLRRVTNPADEAVQLASTASGLLSSMTTPRGHQSTFTYDAAGRLTQDADAAGGSLSLVRTEKLASNSIVERAYDVVVTSGLGRTRTLNAASRTSEVAQRTLRDEANLVTTEENRPNGQQFVVDPSGMNVTRSDGPDPRFGILAAVTRSETVRTKNPPPPTSTPALVLTSAVTRTATLSDPADPLSLTGLTTRVTVNGRVSTHTYSGSTRSWSASSAGGRQVSGLLDSLGRTLQTQVAGLAAVQQTYDGRGRLAGTTVGTGPESRMASFTYNPQGFLANVTDPAGRVLGYSHDAAGRVTQQTLPDGEIIEFGYDLNGNLTSLRPPGRPAHAFTYTPVDLAASYTPPSVPGGGPTLYTYNTDRDLTKITRPDGQEVVLGYDLAGRVSIVTVQRGAYTYAYSPTTGLLTSLTAPGGVGLAYTYDGVLPLTTTWSGPVTGSVGRGYDNDFRVVTQLVNGANPVTFTYDADGLLSQAGAMTMTRGAQHGLLTGATLGSVTEAVTYDTFGARLTYTVTQAGAGIFSQQFVYDKLGRITQMAETVGGTTEVTAYTYDLRGRLTEVRKDGALVATYTYDANGNRLTRVAGGATTQGIYDAQDRLLSYGGTTYTYAANGELTSRTTGGQTTTYQYDELGNLVQAVLPGSGGTLSYVSDGQNRRIGKLRNGAPQQGFLYDDQLRIVAELDGNNQIVSRFVYATSPNVPEYLVKAGTTYRIVTDQVGSPRLVVNSATGAIAQRLDYDEFGNVLQDSAPGFQPFGFAGGLYDRDLKLVRFGARDYDPEVGRWTAKDPIGFLGGQANLYAYVGSNPVSFTDASGLGGLAEIMKGLETALKPVTQVVSKYRDPFGDPLAGPAFDIATGGAKGSNQDQMTASFIAMGMDPVTARLFASTLAGGIDGAAAGAVAGAAEFGIGAFPGAVGGWIGGAGLGFLQGTIGENERLQKLNDCLAEAARLWNLQSRNAALQRLNRRR